MSMAKSMTQMVNDKSKELKRSMDYAIESYQNRINLTNKIAESTDLQLFDDFLKEINEDGNFTDIDLQDDDQRGDHYGWIYATIRLKDYYSAILSFKMPYGYDREKGWYVTMSPTCLKWMDKVPTFKKIWLRNKNETYNQFIKNMNFIAKAVNEYKDFKKEDWYQIVHSADYRWRSDKFENGDGPIKTAHNSLLKKINKYSDIESICKERIKK